MRKIATFVILEIFLIIFSSFLFQRRALAREWEISWPDLPGMTSPTNLPATTQVSIGYLITYVFEFALWIVGFIAFLMLVINAVRYMASGAMGMAGGQSAARQQFINIGLGVLLLFGAFLLLNAINPELTVMGISVANLQVSIPGYEIILYKDGNCTATPPEDHITVYSADNLMNYTWKDGTVVNDHVGSFQISAGLIVRICHNTLFDYNPAPGYTDKGCHIYVGAQTSPTPCINATNPAANNDIIGPNTVGFTWTNANFGAPGDAGGISSVQALGTVNDIQLITFSDIWFSGDYKTYQTSPDFQTQVPTDCQSGGQYGASYWVGKDYNVILCKDGNWNYCTAQDSYYGYGRDAGGSPAVGAGESYQSLCVWRGLASDPKRCVGKLLVSGANRDFIPIHIGCKQNVSTAGASGATMTPGTDYLVNGGDCTIINTYHTNNCQTKAASADSVYSAGTLGVP